MFHSARVKLTGWYLIIIMIISAIFSLAIYQGVVFEIERGLRMQSRRAIVHEQIDKKITLIKTGDIFEELTPEDKIIFEEAKQRVANKLVFINLGIFFVAGGLGYFLSGKTLNPIEQMVNDQKRFIADASHELRTPLTSMKTEIEVNLRDKQLNFSQTQKLILSNLEEINKMQTLINYLLTLSKQQDNQQLLVKKPFSIKTAVDSAFKNIEKLLLDQNLTLVKKIKDTTIVGDQISITELLTILLDNAIKYSPEKNKIIIKTEVHNKKIVILVQDFGIGIKEKDLPHIFNRFYRADNSRSKTKIDGYGLGLSIAKSIVDNHHGQISVTSKVNQGSTFKVELPIA